MFLSCTIMWLSEVCELTVLHGLSSNEMIRTLETVRIWFSRRLSRISRTVKKTKDVLPAASVTKWRIKHKNIADRAVYGEYSQKIGGIAKELVLFQNTTPNSQRLGNKYYKHRLQIPDFKNLEKWRFMTANVSAYVLHMSVFPETSG